MLAVHAGSKLSKPPGQTAHNERVRDEVSVPLVHVSSEAGELGPLLFGHTAVDHVNTGLRDEGSLQTSVGGYIEKARGSTYSPHANSASNGVTTDMTNNVTAKVRRVAQTVSAGDFTGKVRSDVTKLGSWFSSVGSFLGGGKLKLPSSFNTTQPGIPADRL
jgi:hypothetical protein